MRQTELQTNLETTLGDMRDQLGVEAGGPTGACSLVVLGAMTGARLDFNNIPSSPEDLTALEQEHGLFRARIHNPSLFVVDAIRILLTQNRLSFDGIIAQGRIPAPGRPESHAISIVVDERRRTSSTIDRMPLGVVDSLVEGGFRSLAGQPKPDAVTDAGIYVQGRFLPHRPWLSLALNEEGKEQFRGGNLIELPGRISVGLLRSDRRG